MVSKIQNINRDRNVYKVTCNSSSLRREIYFSQWSKFSTLLPVKRRRCSLPCSWVGSRDWFSIAPGPFRVSGFLWHSSKWARQSALGILQYTSGLEVLACSFDTNFILAKCIFITIVIFLRIVFDRNDGKLNESRGL